jgi:hypothetical protein
MTSRLHTLVIACLTVLSLGLLAGVAGAAADDRKTLILRGRIVDADHWPVAGVRVTMSGDRRGGTQTDASGQYELQVAIGTPEDLARRPIELRVRPALKGWRIALAGGDAELGLSLRAVTGDDGVVRCEIRSNEPRVTSAIARVLTSDGEAMAVAPVGFFAEPGEPVGLATSVELSAVDRVALAGVSPMMPAPVKESGPMKAAKEKPAKPQPTAKAEPTPTKIEPAKTEPTKTKPAKTEDPARALAAARKQEQAVARATAKAEQRRRRDEARERERLEKIARSEAAAREHEEQRRRKTAERTTAERTAAEQKAAERTSKAATLIAESQPADPPPAVAPSAEDPPATADHSPRIVPVPEGQPRARARPMLIRNPPVRDPVIPPPDTCGCRIEGTVEVRSERPLASRQRVAVSLAWYPALADTVELFMGSPRAFVIPDAPCGAERLKVTALGSQRFDVVSREAMAGFKCQPGERHQRHVVLVPR